MKNLVYTLLLIACTIVYACNHYGSKSSPSQNPTERTDSVPHLSRTKADSLKFRLTHHYSENYNFRVKSDSIILVPRAADNNLDTCSVYNDDLLVVADIQIPPSDTTDTVWVKVARDQFTMGWVKESDLLPNVVPNDIISMALDSMTGSRAAWMLAIIAFGTMAYILRRYHKKQLQILKFKEMDSFYPILFLMLTASLSFLYASIQAHTPEYWQEFYFHPTLNPLQLPPTMSLLVVLAWSVVIAFIAVVDDVYNNFYFAPGIMYLLETLGLGMIVYLLFSWTTLIGIGHILLPLFIATLTWIYFRYIRCTYTCGQCGYRMHSSGQCPHCGTYNTESDGKH